MGEKIEGDGREIWKTLAVGAGSALISGIGVGMTFILLFSVRNARIEATQEATTKNVEKLAGSVETLESLFRAQIADNAKLTARLDSYIEALRDRSTGDRK